MRLPWKTKTELLLEQIHFLQAQVAQLQSYILATTPIPTGTQPAEPVKYQEPDYRLYSNEVEEDIEFQRQEGIIDDDFAEHLLKLAGAENTEIEIN